MPSFAIEVPGEANPLTEQSLVSTLRAAASSDPNFIQTGTKQLAQWEKAPRYYDHLLSVYLEEQLPFEVRFLAISQLKNGIDKYWRKTALNAVSKEDKTSIRTRLILAVLIAKDNRLAVQAAQVIAKIARYEYPNDWPEAFSELISRVRSPNSEPHHLARAFLALLYIVKELSTGRLIRTRQHLQTAAPEAVSVAGNVYARLVEKWMTAPNVDDMQLSLLALKLLRRLLVVGYEHPYRDDDVESFWSLSQQHLGMFIERLNPTNAQFPHELSHLLGRHTLQLAKLHHEMARDHPASFALLPTSLELTNSYWAFVKDFGNVLGSKEAVTSAVASAKIGSDGDADDDQPYSERVSLKGLLLLRACVKMVFNPTQTFKYKTSEDKAAKARAEHLLRTVLSDVLVRDIMETLVTKYFVFRASDLRDWLEEPEEWEKREEGDGEDWEFSIRSCSEKLFLDLAVNYKDIIIQPLLDVFHSVATPQNEDILFKDSVYTAIGLSASILYQHLDFDKFIRDVLVQEVQKNTAGCNILRRRTAILIGQWISVKVAQESRPLVYQIFQHLLNAEDPLNDQVVRVTAGRQFMHVVNEWEFQAEPFTPYAQTILTQLMQLIEDVELIETKMAILNTISVIVERLEHNITPFAERIVSLLPGLWERSGEEHLMKQAILTILARLVNAMKGDSLPLHSLVFPIIAGAVEPGSETQLYLLEDALDLWSAVLTQTPSGQASPVLLDLVQYLYPIYELGSENLRKSLEITEHYMLLAPQHILSPEVRRHMLVALSKLLGSLRPDANGVVGNLVEMMIQFSQKPEVSSALTLGNFSSASFMIMWELAHAADPETGDVGFIPKLLRGLRGSYIAHCTTGPNAIDCPVDGIVETDYLAVLARMVLASLDGFVHSCQAAASLAFAEQQPLEATMKWLLEEWFSHFDNIGDPGRKKLMCLALTKLLETNQPFILLNLQSLMTIWTEVVTELREDAAVTGGDSLVWGNDIGGAYGDAPEAPEEQRRRELTGYDVIHQINLAEFIQHHLRQAIAACGGQEQFQQQWLVNVDSDVVKAFSALDIL